MAFFTFCWARQHAALEFLFNDTRQARRVQTASLPTCNQLLFYRFQNYQIIPLFAGGKEATA
jgi:hypothetical protein